MPISPIDGCNTDHWLEIKSIIVDTIKGIPEYDIEVKLVSEADDIGVIQKRIVQNIYHSDIVICDVSAKNPNVMFELGMRLAFDKPTIIIKDDKTSYSFDTGVIEHLEYPRDLRFSKIILFKQKLFKSVIATYKKSTNSPSETFLSSFGKFQTLNLNEEAVPADKMMIQMLTDLSSSINTLKNERKYKLLQDNTIEEKKFIFKILDLMALPYMQKNQITDINKLHDNKIFEEIIKKEIMKNGIFIDDEEFSSYYSEWFCLDEDFLPF